MIPTDALRVRVSVHCGAPWPRSVMRLRWAPEAPARSAMAEVTGK